MKNIIKIIISFVLVFIGLYLFEYGPGGLIWMFVYLVIATIGGGTLIDMWKNRKK